jgi:hypothetical protein
VCSSDLLFKYFRQTPQRAGAGTTAIAIANRVYIKAVTPLHGQRATQTRNWINN